MRGEETLGRDILGTMDDRGCDGTGGASDLTSVLKRAVTLLAMEEGRERLNLLLAERLLAFLFSDSILLDGQSLNHTDSSLLGCARVWTALVSLV